MNNATAYSLIRPYDSDYRIELINGFIKEKIRLVKLEIRQAINNGLIDLI